ncbi:MAG: SEC-C metal-binding domain-containing protein [Pseudoxanthomonas sp.]
MSTLNLRLADALKAEAMAYAGDLGISLNALVAVAVRDYLDVRKRGVVPARALALEAQALSAKPAPARPARARAEPVASAPVKAHAALPVAKVGRNEPCPCGSGRKYKQCHGGRP